MFLAFFYFLLAFQKIFAVLIHNKQALHWIVPRRERGQPIKANNDFAP